MPVLEMENVHLKYGNRQVLENINWTIEKGENWALFGLNGSGKTSLLSLASAYVSPSKGTTKLLGQFVDRTTKEALRKRIGFISSSFFDRYYKDESILDIVLSGRCGHLGLDGTINAKDVRSAKKWLTEFGLHQRMRYTYDMLSQGQKQRVLIARALNMNPELLILDEPCSGMDILAKETFLHILMELQKRGTNLIYVSHNTEEFLPIFTHGMLLKEGKIFAKGKIDDVFTNDKMSIFLEVPAVVSEIKGRKVVSVEMNENGGVING